MSTTCKYCNEPEDKQYRPGLICENCICFVHLTCLKRAGTPGDLSGDVFFDFTCEDCSPEKEEIFKRTKILWVHALLLTLYHLRNHMSGMSNHRYFHYKTHICSFIDRCWIQLFGPKFKQKKNWIGTIAGALSVYSNLLFQSGLAQLGESGWWKLKHNFSPAAAAHIIQEISRDKTKSRPRNQLGVDMTLFIAKVTELGYKDQLVEEEVFSSPNPTPAKKRRLEYEDFLPSDVQDYVKEEKLMSPIKQEVEEDRSYYEASTASISSRDNFSDVDLLKEKFDYPAYIPPINFQSDSSSVHSYKYSYNCDSDSSLRELPSDTEVKKEKTKRNEEKAYTRRESLFSTQLNSADMPWLSPPEPTNDVVEMTEYEEIQLLKTVEALVLKVRDSGKKAYLSQLKAKLALRRLKRHKHIPVFDLDKTVKILGGYVTEDKKITSNIERVLDRFQRSYLIDNLSGTIASTNYGTVLLSSVETTPFRSSYSGATLKPFIRRDRETTPIWLKLMDELLRKTHKHKEGYNPPPRATIDYSYLKPQHIAAVNKLCAQYFWPGIDLTEALQYPEFSCVVTYKKLVIGCAFLVPDIGHNQAYISFVLTRPEWRRANIATFMLYHLLQTCSGQDVTLHVSPTNPAIFLYQKFGFKVEELIQDFYEKYYDMDYKGCRHALFLRLVR